MQRRNIRVPNQCVRAKLKTSLDLERKQPYNISSSTSDAREWLWRSVTSHEGLQAVTGERVDLWNCWTIICKEWQEHKSNCIEDRVGSGSMHNGIASARKGILLLRDNPISSTRKLLFEFKWTLQAIFKGYNKSRTCIDKGELRVLYKWDVRDLHK